MLTDALARSRDVVVAAVLLIGTAPIQAGAAAAVALTLGRPILFRHERAGKDGRPFLAVKLRTMRSLRPGETEGPDDAARSGRVGRFLRATSIDELPQLWNVLRGDMTLVGPRPLPVRYVERFSARQRRRLEVKPGITGWAQIQGRNAIDWPERLELDVWYVEHRSLMLDARILLRTAVAVLRRTGIDRGDTTTMTEFGVPPI